MRLERLTLAAALLLVPAAALAQAPACTVPDRLPRPRPEGPTKSEPRRQLPIGSYTLAVTWAPQYCRARGRDADERFRCGGGNRFGFTLHGLWPDGPGKEWPQYCRPAEIVSEPVVRRHLCATPSVQLLQHEWAKHGTCMSADPASYFATATRLYRRLRYPDMDALSRRPNLTATGFARAFAAANPGLDARMVRLNLAKGGWLEEVWLCLGTGLTPHRCPATQGGAPAGAKVRIWRGGPAGRAD